MALFGSKASRLVGLDVGSSSIKMVVLQQTRIGFQVAAAGIEQLPSGTIVEGVIAKPEGVVNSINRIFESQDLKDTQVASSVSGHAVIVKKIVLPVSDPGEVSDSIQWEAEQYIPFDIADVYLDYHLLGPTEDGTGTNVILVAAKRETIDSQSDVIAISGKQPMIMDIDAFALLDEESGDVSQSVRDREVVAALARLEEGWEMLDAFADQRAAQLAEDHIRLRRVLGSQARVRVTAVRPVDVIGLYVLLPAL